MCKIEQQEQAQAHRHGHLVPRQGEGDERLAADFLAERPTILARDAQRADALLGQGCVVAHQAGVGPAHQPIRGAAQFRPKRAVIPRRAGNDVLQLVVARQPEAGGHRLQALAIPGAEQAAQVLRCPGPPRLAPHRSPERPQPRVEVLLRRSLCHGRFPQCYRRIRTPDDPQSAQVVLGRPQHVGTLLLK